MKGKLVIIIGPSASGKTLLLQTLLKKIPDSVKAVTTTTRPPRADEVQARDYFFVNHAEFEKGIKNGDIFEYIEFSENLYGSSKKRVDALLEKHSYVLMILDVRGAKIIKELIPEATTIFIHPGSHDILKKRLMAVRDDATLEQQHKRLALAEGEIALAHTFDAIVYNHENRFDETVNEVMKILKL